VARARFVGALVSSPGLAQQPDVPAVTAVAEEAYLYVDGIEVRGTRGYITAPFWLAGVLSLVQLRERPAAAYGYAAAARGRAIKPVVWEERPPAWPDSARANEASAIQRHLAELYQTLTAGVPSVSTGEDGAAALEIGLAAYHSALANSSVPLPLEERRLRVINR